MLVILSGAGAARFVPPRFGARIIVVIHIFIPFWGEPDYLYEAVHSVLEQDDPDWRLTVVDDCYPEDVSGFFAGLEDERIEYRRNAENLGIIANFQLCQELAAGDYAVFMGCDDLLLPGYVSTVHRVAREVEGVDIVQPGVEVIDADGRVHAPLSDRVKKLLRPRGAGTRVLEGEPLARSLFVGDWLYWPSLAFRTETLKRVRFLEEYEIILDVGLIMDIILAGGRLAVTDEAAFRYRRHSGSLSSVALLDGPRLPDERRFFEAQASRMDQRGWPSAARAARLHLTSRLYAATLVPTALRARRGTRDLLTHLLR